MFIATYISQLKHDVVVVAFIILQKEVTVIGYNIQVYFITENCGVLYKPIWLVGNLIFLTL